MSQSEKWLLILVNQALTPEETELLQKICQALDANIDTDAKVFICDSSRQMLFSDVSPGKTNLILSFGISPETIGIWIDLKDPGIRFLESFCFILSVPISELIRLPTSKKTLWSAMQSYLQTKKTPL